MEIKHPNVTKQLFKLVGKFNKKLAEAGRFGVFVVGLEDAFKLEPGNMFRNEAEMNAWFEVKRHEVETFGRSFLPFAAKLPRVLVPLQTWAIWLQAGGGVSLRREGNAVLFDQRADATTEHYAAPEAVVKAFNPQKLWMWSEIKEKVLATALPEPPEDDTPEAGGTAK